MDDMQQGKQYDHLFEYILDTVVNKNTVLIFVSNIFLKYSLQSKLNKCFVYKDNQLIFV